MAPDPEKHDRRIRLRVVFAFVLIAAAGLGFVVIQLVLIQYVGQRDFAYAVPDVYAPTGEKPQSKLWFNDGTWWGSLFDPSSAADPDGAYHIYRFDRDARTWIDTGTLLDKRNASTADTLWDGEHLYVATAVPGGESTDSNAYLLRYSYDSATEKYTRDEGFPVEVGTGGMEAIVLARDSTGKVWVTYTRQNRVYVNRSLDDDGAWDTPFVLPVAGTSVTADDISAVIAFDSKIGVMWSNQRDDTMHFAIHEDGDPADAWQGEIAARGSGYADDHISLAADPEGRIFAVTKTSLDDAANPDPNAPLIRLLVRDAGGNWKEPAVFGRVRDGHTRPIVKLDQTNRKLYVFATAPVEGGTIHYKQASLDEEISFPEGRGKPFIRGGIRTYANNATSMKQNVGDATGLLVLAADDSGQRYLHNTIELRPTSAAATRPQP